MPKHQSKKRDNRESLVFVRVTALERRRILTAAKARGLSMSAYIRMACFDSINQD